MKLRSFVWFLAKEQVLNGFSCSCRCLERRSCKARWKLVRNYLPCLALITKNCLRITSRALIIPLYLDSMYICIIWTIYIFLQVPQTGDGFLNFTSIRREHSGWYKCTSRHLNFQYSSIGYYLSVRCEYYASAGENKCIRKLDRVCVKLPQKMARDNISPISLCL